MNTWDRISVERWIFTAAHELGHLLLHPAEYDSNATHLPADTEREADAFASEFLMPDATFEAAWVQTDGHPLLLRVLKVKRIFRVSYKTVLYRLGGVPAGGPARCGARSSISIASTSGARYGKPMNQSRCSRASSPGTGGRSGEPERLSRHDFVEDRLSRLVRRALQEEHISLGRSAEILGLSREQMRQRVREWVN